MRGTLLRRSGARHTGQAAFPYHSRPNRRLLGFRRLCLETLENRYLLSVAADNPDTLLRGVELTSPADMISVRYDLPSLLIEPTGESIDGQCVSQTTMAGTEQSYQAGVPMLPVVPVEVVVPAGRTVASIDVMPGVSVALPGSYVIEAAAQPELVGPLTEAGYAEMCLVAQGEAALSETASESLLEIVGVQRQRGVNILTVNLHPVRYTAESGAVSYYTSLTLNVTLGDDGSQGLASEQSVRYRTDELRSLESEVANPSDLESYQETPVASAALSTSGICSPAESYQYVVITSQAMLDATTDYTILDLVAAKRAFGMSATAVSLENIYASYTGVDQPEQIRNFITDAYNNWETDFVLLGGDTNILPYRGLWVNAMSGYALNIPSDMYYQCLDGNYNSDGDIYWGEYHDGPGGGDVDLRPEVYIGRASAETPAEMANFVYKSLRYQSTAGDDYRRDAMMLGEWLGFEGVSEYATSYMEEIRLGTSSAGYTTAGFASDPTFTTSTMYDSETYTWSASQVVAELNSDAHGVYNHLGHANQYYVMKLRNADVDALTNDNLFFMYSQGCDPGDFPYDAIAEHFTTSTRHGAAAVVFNSKNGWGARNSTDSPAQRPNREFWDALFNEDMNQLGVMNADSHVDVLWGITNNLPLRWEIYQTNLLGDPAAEVVSLDLAVIGSTPCGGDVLASRPTDFAVVFNDPYLGSSVDAGDLCVNGLPANSFTLTDARTITFHFNTSPVTVEGLQTMSVAAGTVLRASDQEGNRSWTSQFRYDVAPLQVVSAEPADGSVIPLPLTTLRIHASEEIDPASVNPIDLTLSQGSVIAAVRTAADTVEYTISGTSQEGTLTVSMSAGALTDIYGNPSTAYSGSLILDWVTTAFPTPLTARAPLGSLVYEGSITGHVTSTLDTDSFTIDLDAGQTLTALAVPGDGLQPTLTMVGPGGTSGPAAASGAGQQVLLQTVAASTAGTTGGYTLQLILNAALENEAHDGATNDTFDAAQSIDAAFLALGDAGKRAAALGALSASAESEDYFRFDLTAGQFASMTLCGLAAGEGTLELYDPGRNRLAASIVSTDGGFRISDFLASTTGSYHVRIAGRGLDYSLVVTKNLGLEDAPTADLGLSGQVLGYAESVTTLYSTRAEFIAAFPGLPVEDFEEGRVSAGTFINFAGPAQYGVANAAFAATDILPGVAIQSDVAGNPSNEMFLVGSGMYDSPSKAIGCSWGSENTEITFLQQVYQLAFDAAGTFRYVPQADFCGTDSFTYAAYDGVSYSPAVSVSITVRSVNDSPAGADSRVTILEDATYVLTRADFGFFDPFDVPPHGFAAVRISDLPRAGLLKLDGTPVVLGQLIAVTDVDLGRLTFSPSPNANGVGCASFSFQVQDDGGTLAGGVPLDPTANTLTFDVTPVNDSPVGTDATKTLLEDVPCSFAAADFGFTDPLDSPAHAMTGVMITTVPAGGGLTLDGVAVHEGQFISTQALSSLLLRFSVPGNMHGAAYASFTFQVVDDGGTGEGGANFDLTPRTMSIDVTSVNDEPSGTDTRFSIVAGQAYPFLPADFGFSDTADTPPNAFERVWIVTVPAQGSLMLNGAAVIAGQSVTVADIQLGRLTYLPADYAAASPYASFTFQVQDDGGTVNGGQDTDLTPNTITIDLAAVSLDADGNGTADALTDGILILRYLFDPEGQWNFSDALGNQASRTGRHAIRCFLDGGRTSTLDVDGNGTADALTDGILILRYLFDPTGMWNFSDALGAGATRTSRAAIKAYLDVYASAATAAGSSATELGRLDAAQPPSFANPTAETSTVVSAGGTVNVASAVIGEMVSNGAVQEKAAPEVSSASPCVVMTAETASLPANSEALWDTAGTAVEDQQPLPNSVPTLLLGLMESDALPATPAGWMRVAGHGNTALRDGDQRDGLFREPAYRDHPAWGVDLRALDAILLQVEQSASIGRDTVRFSGWIFPLAFTDESEEEDLFFSDVARRGASSTLSPPLVVRKGME